MELNELKAVWKSYDSKLEKSLKLNLHCLELIQAQKVKSKLAPIYRNRVVEIVFHSIAALLLLAFLFKNFSLFPYAACAVLLLSFYVTAIVMCLKQIAIIKRMDYSNDVITIQSSLVILQTHIVNYMRLSVLFIPAFLAFPGVVSKVITDFNIRSLSFMDLLTQYHGNWWNIQLMVTLILIPLCTWFYLEVSYKNVHKHWVKKTIDNTSGKRVRKAMEFIKELEGLKND